MKKTLVSTLSILLTLDAKVSVGKVDYTDFENMTATYGFILDNYFSGIKAIFGDQRRLYYGILNNDKI